MLRVADPARMVRAYANVGATMNPVRSVTSGGMADLHDAHEIQRSRQPTLRKAQMYKKNDVVLVSWPTQGELRRHCVNNRTPRILILESNCQAPASEDILEDWVRQPISRRDLSARVEVLQRRYIGVCTPEIDEGGELRYGLHSVTVSETQAELVRLLVSNFGVLDDSRSIRRSYDMCCFFASVKK
jgi:hypothetical protein